MSGGPLPVLPLVAWRVSSSLGDVYRFAGCGQSVCPPIHTFTAPGAPVDMLVAGGPPAADWDSIFAYGLPPNP